MNRIERKFKELKNKKKKAFIAFITAGHPNLAITKQLIIAFERIGVDIVELGVPFSDPLADGPIIQEASQAALNKNISLKKILNLVKEVRKDVHMPICLMTYYNPIFCFGEEKFVRSAVMSGVDGVIVPDLPPDEGKLFLSLANKNNLDVICFIAPTTSSKRMKYIASIAKGFIYYVSLTGVTGPRENLPDGLKSQISSIKRMTRKPICVGFGISRPSQVKEIYKFADGVIVGSAIVKKIKENTGNPDLIKRVTNFVEYLKNV